MKMEGEAYNWYMWWKKTTLAISWRKFKDVFFKIFQGIKEEELFSTLIKLRQKGNVDEYTREWETLATRVPGLSESRLVQSFISGLKTHIKVELELHDITGIEAARQKEKVAKKRNLKSYFGQSQKEYIRDEHFLNQKI